MGNSICSCNQKQDGEDVSFYHGKQETQVITPKHLAKALSPEQLLMSSQSEMNKLVFLQLFFKKRFMLLKEKDVKESKMKIREAASSTLMDSHAHMNYAKSNFEDKTSKYNGEYENGSKQGFGIQTWKDGAVYRGYFYDDKANFIGIFVHSDNDIYKGEFKEDKASGYGIYQHANGAYYEGNWVEDTQDGYGVEVWTDGSEYRGEYIKGKKSGYGNYIWADGSSYQGEWFDNTLHGFVSILLINKGCLLLRR